MLKNQSLVDQEFFRTISNTQFDLDEDDAIYVYYEWNKKKNTIKVLNAKVLDGFLTSIDGRNLIRRKVARKSSNVDCHDKNGNLLWSEECKTALDCYNLIKKYEKDRENCWEICNLSMIYIPSSRTFYLD